MQASSPPSVDRIEQIIAHAITHRDPASIPLVAHAAAQVWLEDSIGVALAGTAVPQSAQVLAAVRGWGRASDARVWGTDETMPATSAALVNAFHIHNQEFDCVHEKAVVHPMAVILASLLTVADRLGAGGRPVSGAALSAALVIAVDTAAVIGMSATTPIRFFRPAQCGSLGATAGLCVLMGFDAAQMRDAFGLAYSQLAGTMQAHIEGTPTLALQVGFAARAAVSAVELAAQGFRGPHQVLEGKHGYFNLMEPDAAPSAPFAELGQVWQITRVSHKPYPTGRAAQGGISGLRALMLAHRFSASEIESVVVYAPPLVRQLVGRPMIDAMSVNYARLCMPFLLATTLVRGNVDLTAYRAEFLTDANLREIAARISMAADQNTDPNALRPQMITVKLRSGVEFQHPMEYVYGAPEAPMSIDEQTDKFLACCAFAARPHSLSSARRLQTKIRALASLTNVSDIVDHCIPSL